MGTVESPPPEEDGDDNADEGQESAHGHPLAENGRTGGAIPRPILEPVALPKQPFFQGADDALDLGGDGHARRGHAEAATQEALRGGDRLHRDLVAVFLLERGRQVGDAVGEAEVDRPAAGPEGAGEQVGVVGQVLPPVADQRDEGGVDVLQQQGGARSLLAGKGRRREPPQGDAAGDRKSVV